jgi:hypothetical protein
MHPRIDPEFAFQGALRTLFDLSQSEENREARHKAECAQVENQWRGYHEPGEDHRDDAFVPFLLPLIRAGLTLSAQSERTPEDSKAQRVLWVGESLKAMQSGGFYNWLWWINNSGKWLTKRLR